MMGGRIRGAMLRLTMLRPREIGGLRSTEEESHKAPPRSGEDEDESRGSVGRAIKAQHAMRFGDGAEPRQGLAASQALERHSREGRASLGGCL
jgi:hypothetical protein